MAGSSRPMETNGLVNGYNRPNSRWECGHLASSGCPCSIGPTKKGQCSGGADCHPAKSQDSWICTRPEHQGGRCEKGPNPDGSCCTVRPCTPNLTLRYRRRMIAFSCVWILIGSLLMLWGSGKTNEVLVPGALSSGHAQLLMHKGKDRCASCHPGAHTGLTSWVDSAVSGKPVLHGDKSQSHLCLECHKANIDPNFGMTAHNLSESQRRSIQANKVHLESKDSKPFSFSSLMAIDKNRSQSCASCHQEHKGSMTIVDFSNKSCLSCHQQETTCFEKDHPEFRKWPAKISKSIRFNHASHSLKHFPSKNSSFHCQSCHQPDEDGIVMKVVSYDKACSQCHDKQIESSFDDGWTLVQLPMMDTQAFKDLGVSFGHWPRRLDGDFDGKIPSWTRILLQADGELKKTLQKITPDMELIDLDPANKDDLKVMASLGNGLKRLLLDLAVRGRRGIQNRLEIVLQRKVSENELDRLSYGFSKTVVQDSILRWFPNIQDEFQRETVFPISPFSKQNTVASALQYDPRQVFGKLEQRRQEILAKNPLLKSKNNQLQKVVDKPNVQGSALQEEGSSDSSEKLLTKQSSEKSQENHVEFEVRREKETPNEMFQDLPPVQRKGTVLAANPLSVNEFSPRSRDEKAESGSHQPNNPFVAKTKQRSEQDPIDRTTSSGSNPDPKSLSSNVKQKDVRSVPQKQVFWDLPPVNEGELLEKNPLATGQNKNPGSAPGTRRKENHTSSNGEMEKGIARSLHSKQINSQHEPNQNQLASGNNEKSAEKNTVNDKPEGKKHLSNKQSTKDFGQPNSDVGPLQGKTQIAAAPNWESFGKSSSGQGWLRSDRQFSIGYHGSGHQDLLMKAWLELAQSEKKSMSQKDLKNDSLLALGHEITKMESTGNCMQCHNPNSPLSEKETALTLLGLPSSPEIGPKTLLAEQNSSSPEPGSSSRFKILKASSTSRKVFDQLTEKVEKTNGWGPGVTEGFSGNWVHWKGVYRDSARRGFTKFRHRPHLMIEGKNGCTGCHQIDQAFEIGVGSESRFSEFKPITLKNCTSCHQQGGASNQCSTCHNYHVGSKIQSK